MTQMQEGRGGTEPENLVTLTHIMYGLHAFSVLSGLLGTAFVVTAFLAGWPSIIAIIINYLKRDAARGSFLESHFRWQRRTFWFALLWLAIAAILILTLVGIPLAWLLLVVVGLWITYRILRGWLRLGEAQPMPS